MDLPQDNYVLLSFLNTKLRDEFSSLDELCAVYGVSLQDICGRMAEIGYKYDDENNRFA